VQEVWRDRSVRGLRSGRRAAGDGQDRDVRADPGAIEIDQLHKAFLAQYEDRYGHANPGRQIAVSGVRVVAVAASHKPDLTAYQDGRGETTGSAQSRKVIFRGKEWDCAVLQRDSLKSGETREDPAIIEESGSTTIVPPGWSVKVDEFMNINLIHRSNKQLQ